LGHTWFNWSLKERWVMSILRDRWEWLDIASVTLLGLVVLGGLIAWVVRRRRPDGLPLVLAATVMAALFAVMPFALLGSAYADMRLAPFVLATALLAVGTPQSGARSGKGLSGSGSSRPSRGSRRSARTCRGCSRGPHS
jgi:hypothetical protein